MNKKIPITACILILVFICVAAIEPTPKSGDFKNLQVLPKDISGEILLRIMEVEFNKGLGVGCDYCHAKVAGTTDLDFASDARGEKEMARSMMRMTMEINQKYFGMQHPMIGDSLMSISCKTCHKGSPNPSYQPDNLNN